MNFNFPPEPIVSHAKYITPTINKIDYFLCFTCHKAFTSGKVLSLSTKHNKRQAAISTISMKKAMYARLRQLLSHITSIQKCNTKDPLFRSHSPSFSPLHSRTKPGQNHQTKVVAQNTSTKPENQSWWRGTLKDFLKRKISLSIIDLAQSPRFHTSPRPPINSIHFTSLF